LVDYAYAHSRDESSTSSTSPVTKVTLTFTAEAADYVIFASADSKGGGGTYGVRVQLTLDGAEVATYPSYRTCATYGSYFLCVLKNLAAGSHTLLLRYYTSVAGGTVYIRNAAVFVVKASLFVHVASTNPADTTTTSATFVDLATFTFNAQAGTYVIIGSMLTWRGTAGTVIWRIVDENANELGRTTGDYSEYPHHLVFKVVDLSAGTRTFKLQGLSSGGDTGYFQTIHLIALKLPDDRQYSAQEGSGTGTRVTLTWTPLTDHDILIFDQTQMSTANARDFNRATTVLSSAQPGVAMIQTLGGMLRFAATGVSESFTTSTAGTSPLSRILALDLSTLIEGEEDIPTQPVAQVMCPIEPQIIAEVYPPLDWEGDVLPNTLLPVVTGKVVRSGGFEVSWFAVQVADKDGRIESLLRYFDPIWVWVQAEGVIERYLYRIESFERAHSSDGWMVDVRGRSWGGAPLAQRGFVDDKDLGVEISDAIINPTYGLGPTLLPELGCGLYVRNVGRSITVTHTRGTKAKAALDDYKAYAKGTGTEWGHWTCSGDDKDEWGKPNLHFDKVSRDISPIELIVGKTLFLATGKSIFEFANWQILCYGLWGSELDKTAQPTLGPIIDSYSETNSDTEQALYSGSVVAVGQAFTLASDKIIDEAEFYLRKQGSPTGNYVAKLYRATGTVGTDAKPEGNPIASTVEKAISQLTTTKQKIRIPFISPRIGMKGEKYVVAVEYSGGDASNYLVVGCDASSPTHSGNYCSKTGATWTANSARDLCFYLHSAEHQVGVSPEYRRLVAPGATEAEALAQTLVDAKGVPSIYHVVHTPFTHGIKENSRILILDPIMLLPQIARVNKRAFTVDYDDDGWKQAYLEVTLGGLSFGSTLV